MSGLLSDSISVPTVSARNSVFGDLHSEIVTHPMSPLEDSKNMLLEQSNFFHGVSNGVNGPYHCSLQVAKIRPQAICSLRPSQDITIEDLHPTNEVDARFTHLGWPALSALPARPWDILSQGTQPSGTWVSRRMVVHKLKISIRIEDLVALDPFVVAVSASFEHSTTAGQIRALRQVFAAWGDMIALSAVIGASLSATGTLAANQTLTGDATSFRPSNRGPDIMQKIDQSLDITGNFEKRLESLIQGGSPELFSQSDFDTWLADAVNVDSAPTWEIVKVYHAAPITELLPDSLRERVNQLFSYATLVSRSPCVGSQISFGFDGASLGIRNIKQIDIWYNEGVIQDISVRYADDAACGPHAFGKSRAASDTFALARGEFITGVFIWYTSESITSLQFVKNTSQISALYGLQTGASDLAVFAAGGEALLGLSGSFNPQNLRQMEAVWRSDTVAQGYRSIATSCIGTGINSTIFNDYRYLGNPSTAYISQIRYRKDIKAVSGLQITYTSQREGRTINQETPIRGTEGGEQETWTLTPGEYINQVKGKYKDGVVYQLEILTNKGSTRKFGMEDGEPFNFLPPNRDMVLYYILGKSAELVQALTFVWGSPPS